MIAPAAAEEPAGQQDLAKQLANPVAALISVPLQINYDSGYGPDEDGSRASLNIQPVVPISLSDDWTVISRTILPVTWQDEIFPGAGTQFGLGDTLQSFFFSPQQPGPGGLIWGAGPVLLLPTATDDLLGGNKWGAGPTAVALIQRSGWTVGWLGNHIWSVAGDDDAADVSRTYLQPFISYTTADSWTFNLNTEATYDWEAETWSLPINLQASKLLRIGSQPISIGGGLRYWAESPDGGPQGLGFRLVLTFLFPT